MLHTPRLLLREMTDSDLDDMAALLGDPAVMAHYPRPKTRAEAQAWIDWTRGLYRTHGFGLWVVTLRDGTFVGDCGLTPQLVGGRTEVEVGYHVRSEMQGRGYASEAAEAVRDHARDALAVTRLIAIIDPDNRPSQRVAEKIGLRREQRLRWEKSGMDVVIYGGPLSSPPPAPPAGPAAGPAAAR